MGRLTLSVIPGCQKPEIEFISTPPGLPARPEVLKVRLRAPPLEGRANRELEQFLSDASGVAVRVVRGSRSRTKTIEFDADEAAFLGALAPQARPARPK